MPQPWLGKNIPLPDTGNLWDLQEGTSSPGVVFGCGVSEVWEQRSLPLPLLPPQLSPWHPLCTLSHPVQAAALLPILPHPWGAGGASTTLQRSEKAPSPSSSTIRHLSEGHRHTHNRALDAAWHTTKCMNTQTVIIITNISSIALFQVTNKAAHS